MKRTADQLKGMSGECATVLVSTEAGPVRINADEYDASVHTLAEGSSAPASSDTTAAADERPRAEKTKAELVDELTVLGVTADTKMTKADLLALFPA